MILPIHNQKLGYAFIFVLLILLFISFKAYAADNHLKEYPDIFVHEDIQISSEQTIGRLMVASGNAIIAGKVTKGILIADGDLSLEDGASISGNILILGGSINSQPGAKLASQPIVIAPKGHPFVSIIILGLYILCGIILILVPMLLWLIGHLFKKTRWYFFLNKKVLQIEQRWPAVYMIVSLGISALMLSFFTFLAWETIFQHASDLFDNQFIWLIRYFNNPSIDQAMIFISDLGEGPYFIFLIIVAYCLLLYEKKWLELTTLTICLSGGALLVVLLKNLFQRARPDLFRVIAETGYSFPSGHALLSLCFYGIAAFLIIRNISTWRGRLAVATVAILFILAIGISRIYLGVHYPTDVVAGYAAGSMWLAFCISFLIWQQRNRVVK